MSSLWEVLVTLAALPSLQETPPTTFHRDIAPIVQRHCVQCHRPGEAAPFALIRFDDVERRRRQILTVMRSGYMPPWLPAEGWGSFAEERRLSPQEIERFAQWVESGAEEGNPADAPDLPRFTAGWSLGEPDLVVEMPEPFSVPADGPDLYRNFVLPVSMDGARQVSAVEFRPSNRRVVHHAVVMIDASRRCRMREAEEPGDGPGFPGMDLLGAISPDGHFLGWTPGKIPSVLPDGMSFRLLGTDDVVVQTHLLPTGKPEEVSCKVGFHFTDLACEIRPLQLRLGVRDLDIPAGVSDYTMEDAFVLPVDVRLLAVYPHAHYLGKSMLAWADRPEGTQEKLLRIDDWDFNWQDDYCYREPVELPAGSTLRIRYVYDNSAANPRNPRSPPQDVHYGPSSLDEMGDLWIQMIAVHGEERGRLEETIAARDIESRLLESRTLAAGDPEGAAAQFDLALTYDLAGKAEEAEAGYRRAMELDPEFVSAPVNLASLLGRRGDREEARKLLEAVLLEHPEHANAHQNLGVICDQLGDSVAAQEHLSRAAQLDRTSVEIRVNLATVLERLGEIDRARATWQELLDLLPSSAEIHYRAGEFERKCGELERARQLLRKAVTYSPEHAAAWGALGLVCVALDDADSARVALLRSLEQHPEAPIALEYAWLLSTGAGAAQEATVAMNWSRQAEGHVPSELAVRELDVRAACHAAAGRFKKAERTAIQARDLARERGDETTAKEIEGRIDLYAQGKPYLRTGP